MNAFEQIRIFSQEKYVEHKHSVSFNDFDKFCKTFIFNKIKNETFGKAFCDKFSITDTILSSLKDESNAKNRIRSMDYVK